MTLSRFSQQCLEYSGKALMRLITDAWLCLFKKDFPVNEDMGKVVNAIRYKLARNEMIKSGIEATEKFEKNYNKAMFLEEVDNNIQGLYSGIINKNKTLTEDSKMEILHKSKKVILSEEKPAEEKMDKKKEKAGKKEKVNKITWGSQICVLLKAKKTVEQIVKELSKKNPKINKAYVNWYRFSPRSPLNIKR